MTTPTRPTRERWLGPGVAGIGTASFLSDVGQEIPTALLPNLLTATLGAPTAASDSSKASPTAWPAPLGWPVALWPTTPAAAALWPLAESPLGPSNGQPPMITDPSAPAPAASYHRRLPGCRAGWS